MSINKGFVKEDEMIINLNDHLVKDINSNLKNMLECLFGALDEKKMVKCEVVPNFAKPDIVITYDGEKRYVSMKTGSNNSVHSEYVEYFVDYLKKKGISQETLNTILLFQYGDGTIDGTGQTRMRYNEIMTKYANEIKKANEELNANPVFVCEMVCHYLFDGSRPELPSADVIYYGDIYNGYVVNRQQVRSHIRKRKWNQLNNPHIGPLLIRATARYHDKRDTYEVKRHRVDLAWLYLSEDIKYISQHYFYDYKCKKRD